MGTITIVSFLSSFILTLILTPPIHRLAIKLQAFKIIKNDTQQQQISYLGGLALFFAFCIVVLIACVHQGCLNSGFFGIITGSAVIVLLGLIDDFVELSPGLKFLGQTVAVIALIVFGVTTSIAAVGRPLNILITFLWVFAIINALNLLDIMDGLCSGITAIAAGAFLFISFLSQNMQAAIISAAVLGASLAFLRYNFPPAKIYLGDTGSMFLGFVLAVLAINVDYAPQERKIALLTPIVALGLPIFDTAFVILMRLLRGRPVTKKSKDHFALRLLSAGLSKRRTLLLMYLFGLLFSVSALVISRVSNQQGLAILVLIVVICAAVLKKIGALNVDE
ncbi:MraY family glycosyltransferase [Candidatus Omnitrophota bacterium]